IEENKLDKAKTVIDLAMEKMPIELFGQYEMVEPFVEGYYLIGEKEKARELSEKIIEKYQEQILYFESLDYRHQNAYLSEVYRTIRSEEHTSELQSRENLVCRLLL